MKVENTKICIRKRWHRWYKKEDRWKEEAKKKVYEKNSRERK